MRRATVYAERFDPARSVRACGEWLRLLAGCGKSGCKAHERWSQGRPRVVEAGVPGRCPLRSPTGRVSRIRGSSLCLLLYQIPNAHQVVHREGEHEHRADAPLAPVPRLPHQRDRLEPAEEILAPLAASAGSPRSPGCRVVRPSIALARRVVFAAMCGVTASKRTASTKLRMSYPLSAPALIRPAGRRPPRAAPLPPPFRRSPSLASGSHRRPDHAGSPSTHGPSSTDLASRSLPLAIQLGLRVGRGRMRLVAPLLATEVHRWIARIIRRLCSSPLSVALKLLSLAHAWMTASRRR